LTAPAHRRAVPGSGGAAPGPGARDGRDGRLGRRADKDGRAFAAVPLPLPGVQAPEPVFDPTVGLTLETDCAEFTAPTTAALTERLKAEGFTLGATGWRLGVKASAGGTSEKMTFGPLDKTGVVIPSISGSARLISPKGETVWQGGLGGSFPRKGSKYYTETRREGTVFYGTVTELYDFQGKDPRKAMAEEAGENFPIGGKGLPMPPRL